MGGFPATCTVLGHLFSCIQMVVARDWKTQGGYTHMPSTSVLLHVGSLSLPPVSTFNSLAQASLQHGSPLCQIVQKQKSQAQCQSRSFLGYVQGAGNRLHFLIREVGMCVQGKEELSTAIFRICLSHDLICIVNSIKGSNSIIKYD